MGKEFREILADCIAKGVITPNPIEDIYGTIVPGYHDVPISRFGERHTFGGASAEILESEYEGLSGDIYLGSEIVQEMPWNLEYFYEKTGAEIFNLRTNP